MSKRKLRWIDGNLWLILIALAIALVGGATLLETRTDFSGFASRRVSALLAHRISRLDGYMQKVSSSEGWADLKDLPSDMVVYRYEKDSLTAWYNQFSLDNDDISRRTYIPRFTRLRYSLESPLADVGEKPQLLNLGPKWYIVKAMGPEECRVIGGLEIKNELDRRTRNGVSRILNVSDRFSLYPITFSGGEEIKVQGTPLLKLIQENDNVIPLMPGAWVAWFAVFLLVAAILSYLSNHRTIIDMHKGIAGFSAIALVFLLACRGIQSTSDMFSPTVYAGGKVLYSLAAVLMVNLWILLMVTCVYMARVPIARKLLRGRPGVRLWVYTSLALIAIGAILYYIAYSLTSLIMDSNIMVGLYRFEGSSVYALYVYLSYFGLLLALVLLLQMLCPVAYKLWAVRYDLFSVRWKTALSIISAVCLLGVISVVGFRKEEITVGNWSNRLAIERNLRSELKLRRIEAALASDPLVSSLVPVDKDFRITISHISEEYLSLLSQEYDINLYMFRDSEPKQELLNYFMQRVSGGIAIADSSRFIYSRAPNGTARYTALFAFDGPEGRVARLIIGIDSKSERESTGYSAILGSSVSGNVAIPHRYSYAKYLSGNLTSYSGEYPYPTVFSGALKKILEDSGGGNASVDGYVHFITGISDEEVVVISRRSIGFTHYMVQGFLIVILAYFCLSIPKFRRRRRSAFEKNYYKSRINTVIFLSLTMTLVAMAVVSVTFVYKRNESNVKALMTTKISTIQSIVASRAKYFEGAGDFDRQDITGALENTSSYTNSDISLYSTEGKVVKSTCPDVFERLVIGTRINADAYRAIMSLNKRYYIHKEKFAGHSYYAMYAPVINERGRKVAIICSPYTDAAMEFKNEAAFHAIFIITLFFILMFITRSLTIRIVDKLFYPLIEMGRKMNATRKKGLEYISYDREDEISSLVKSYNLMVHDLAESSKQMAAVERDKAWSEMARQVAHEIKNPLTPIKLQIQRIILLRNKNAPGWEKKLDTIIPVILDSIDNLSDTANEFSTFAKLYSETPVPINLDTLAGEQASLFGDRDNLTVKYIGLSGAIALGPKPQITRVFVNLIANAVQAIENKQKEDEEAGVEPTAGKVMISVRKGTDEGLYEVAVEDNGPGVREENMGRLFTPNFTTKSSGTGLGLAICKNIIERCGGRITYSRSFLLGGACFTFTIPKA